MSDRQIHQGKWWLPESPVNQVSGTLFTNPELILETIGELGDTSFLEVFASDSPLQHGVIWGIDSNATRISVFGCAAGMTQNTSCPFSLVRYKVQVIALGAHIKSWDDLGNYDVKVQFPELPLWFRPNCFHSICKGNDFGFITNIQEANKLSAPIEEGCVLQLEGEAKFSHNDNGLNLTIEQDSVLYFSFDHAISMQDAKRRVYSFEQFLSFATLSPVQCSHFWLIDKDKKKDPQKKFSIEIIDKRVPRQANVRFWEYLFVHETIKDSFGKIIRKWYEEKDLFPIRTHLIDSVSHKGYFEANDFLIICQAIEGFYCRFRNDESLTNIFKNLIDEFADIQIQEVSLTDIPYIQDTRNHFSHLLPPGKKHHVLDGHELYNLNHKVRKLLICCILKLIGFTNDEINVIFANSHNSYLRMISDKKRNIVESEPITLNAQILNVTQISEIEPE